MVFLLILSPLVIFKILPSFESSARELDVDPPTILDYGFDKDAIDTTNQDESLTFYMRISDISGVSDEHAIEVIFLPDNDPGYAMPESAVFELTLMTEGCAGLGDILDISDLGGGCGDQFDGIYSSTIIVPRYSSGGVWRVEHVANLADVLGNHYETVELEATFNNLSKDYDVSAPILKGITITPSVFHTRDSEQTITFELEIEDDKAGVANISIGLLPVLAGSHGHWVSEYTLDKGTILDGKFILEITLPEGSPLGFWKVNNIDVGDSLHREQRYTTQRLALEFPDLPLYLLNQGTSEQVELGSDWTLEDWPYYDGDNIVWPDLSVRFEAGTVITKSEGGVFAFHRMLATKYNLVDTALSNVLNNVNEDHQGHLSACDASEGCVDTSVNDSSLAGNPLHIIKMGIPGLNLSFSKPVTIIIGVEPEHLDSTFVIQTFDIEKETWVDHDTCTVEMIEPESTEHGGDAYGLIMPVAYAGCKFTTDHASFFSANILGETTTDQETEMLPETGYPIYLAGISLVIASLYLLLFRKKSLFTKFDR